MSAVIPAKIVGFRGQCVKFMHWDENEQALQVRCDRDRRFVPVLPVSGQRATVNRRLRRWIRDLPLWGRKVWVSIEYYQLKDGATDRRMEHLPFVDPGLGFTHRFSRFISQLCRYMSIAAVARYSGLAWRTVKAMDRRALRATLPALEPGALTGLRCLGVDEVARAKGHDYVTLIYDLDRGDLLWVGEGRGKAAVTAFLDRLDSAVAVGIEAVAMDMSPAFQAAVREALPQARIVFDRFHVMQNYSKVIDQVRRTEFKRAGAEARAVIKGSRYLLLRNAEHLSIPQRHHLDALLEANTRLNTVYVLKEQLQVLWKTPTSTEAMRQRLTDWCQLAEQAHLGPLTRFAHSLHEHAEGICNYADYPITTARIEAGNVAIGMIRKRARGLLDMDYFKLKIRQTAVPESPLGLYALTG